jgi:tetratricopeptide (TPR) repeat protein
MVYTLKGDLEKAKEQNKKSEELGPQPVGGENAVERAQKLIDRDGRLPQHVLSLARAYLESGQEAEAYKLVDELKKMYEENDIGNVAIRLAQAYLYLNDKDQALKWLEKACEKRDPLLVAINTWTSWDPLRQDPKFKSVLLKMGLER